MKNIAALLLLSLSLGTLGAQTTNPVIIPVNSPAFIFSPGNWTGDSGRTGSNYRETWYPGAYCRVTWTTTNSQPTAALLLDTSSYREVKNPPELTYCIDGVWISGVPCTEQIPITKLKGPGPHTLTLFVRNSVQVNRWGSNLHPGPNAVIVKGLAVDKGSKPIDTIPPKHWALIIGDSITEGSAANFGNSDNLASWSYFVGTGLQFLGYEYGVSACGYSGWLRPGDSSGDVPPYYFVSNSHSGTGGTYDDNRSRWNKIDARNSLLDANGHLSGWGATRQEPDIILINFGTNDGTNVNQSDLQASITQAIQALRKAAPDAPIVIIVPFGQYAAPQLKAAVAECQAAEPMARKISLIDLGDAVAKGLADDGYWSGLHPNMRGHATFAAEILAKTIPQLMANKPTR